MVVSRYLVQGVDLWLNTPRRLLEASGTSGMKAAVNGVINISTLDGWWDEVYSPNVGWAIGHGEEYDDLDYQDDVESQALYNLLEKEVIPLFYDRGRDNTPRKWVALMKSSMAEICPFFNTNRMIREYSERFYLPAQMKFQNLNDNDQQHAKELAAWKASIFKNWSKVQIIEVKGNGENEHQVGSEIEIQAKIDLGNLKPDDVNVEIYHGYVNPENMVVNGRTEKMACSEKYTDNVCTFIGTISCRYSGLYGYTVRILPQNQYLAHPHETGLILWANL